MINPLFAEEPTSENVLHSLEENTFDRAAFSFRVLSGLLGSNFLGQSTIAIDGPWGSGKSFVLKQIYYCLCHECVDHDRYKNAATRHSMNKKLKNEIIDNNSIKTSLLPRIKAIYYDAWANDDNLDPLISVMATICQEAKVEHQVSVKDRMSALLQSFSLSVGPVNIDPGKAVDAIFQKTEISNQIYKRNQENDISALFELVKSVYKAEKLIIIIDELDRCKPEFATRLLERIKHYFNIPSVTFIFGVNIQALNSLLTQQYGTQFDCSSYLNRFFDIRLSLPRVSAKVFLDTSEILDRISDSNNITYPHSQEWQFRFQIITELSDIFNLSIRDMIQLYNEIQFYDTYWREDREGLAHNFITHLLYPILLILRRHKLDAYYAFLNGDSLEPLEYFQNHDEHDYICKLVYSRDPNPDSSTLYENIKDIYNFLFSSRNSSTYEELPVGSCLFTREHKQMLQKDFYTSIPTT